MKPNDAASAFFLDFSNNFSILFMRINKNNNILFIVINIS